MRFFNTDNSVLTHRPLKDTLLRLVVWILGIFFLTILSAVVLTRCALVLSLVFHNRFAPPWCSINTLKSLPAYIRSSFASLLQQLTGYPNIGAVFQNPNRDICLYSWVEKMYQKNISFTPPYSKLCNENGNIMKKKPLKFIVDILLFIDMSSIAVLGILLGLVIPKGRVHPSKKYFLGLHRHEWGDIHFYLSFFLLLLLVFHIWFNWTRMTQSTKHYFGNHWKNCLWGISGAWILVLLLGWIAVRF